MTRYFYYFSPFHVQVRLWRDGEHIKVAKDYDAAKETDIYIDGLRHDVVYKLRVLGYSRAGDGTLSSPTQKFYLGQLLLHTTFPLEMC